MTSFILAVDHRVSLRRWLGSLGVGDAELDAQARRLKTLCVRALESAASELLESETPMLLLDEEYGVEAIARARAAGLPFVVPAERSGEAEFSFEYGDRFPEAIEAVNPSAVKALVRYNPDGDAEANRRSSEGLLVLQQYLNSAGRSFMLELLVPATPQQTDRFAERFDDELRPDLTVVAIKELAAAGLSPQWWKLEGNRAAAAAARVAAAGSRASRRGCLVLGRGQDRDAVIHWVSVAAAAPGYDGFAVGRTLWTGPFAALLGGHVEETEAVGQIAAAYLDIVAAYRGAQALGETGAEL